MTVPAFCHDPSGLAVVCRFRSLYHHHGKDRRRVHFTDPGAQTVYLQKMFFIMASLCLGQIWWGHRLPLVTGPSSILLIGVTASRGFDLQTIYTAAMLADYC